MLTESTIILPRHDNLGTPVDLARYEYAMVKNYGGFTRAEVSGAWIDPDTEELMQDNNMRYTIAADWSSQQMRDSLRTIAVAAATGLDQECIYICMSGNVEFIKPMALMLMEPMIAEERVNLRHAA